jgi:histidinol dehydrogenase
MKAVQRYEELDLQKLNAKSYGDDALLEAGVAEIIKKVKEQGNEALLALTARFDGVVLSNLKVTDQESPLPMRKSILSF